MNFQRARTQEQIDQRQEEIILAADSIYTEQGFEAVHFKSISERTTFSRPTIYNYYHTKEEVLLDVLKREYLQWHRALQDGDAGDGERGLCGFFADSLLGREKFLSLLSVDYTRIEMGSSVEKLTGYKRAIQVVYRQVSDRIAQCFPGAAAGEREDYALVVFSLMGGLFPLLHLSEKQRAALQSAAPGVTPPGFYETFERLLRAQENSLRCSGKTLPPPLS